MGFWLNAFLTNWLINILLVEYCLAKLSGIIKVDEERDQKYKAFRRDDVKWMNRLWLYPTCHFTLFKLCSVFGMLFFTSTLATATTYGQDLTKPITGIRRWMIRVNLGLSSRYIMWAASGC